MGYFLGSLQDLTCHRKWAPPGSNVPNFIHSQNPGCRHRLPGSLWQTLQSVPFPFVASGKMASPPFQVECSCWKYSCTTSNTTVDTNKLCLYKVELMTFYHVSQHLRYWTKSAPPKGIRSIRWTLFPKWDIFSLVYSPAHIQGKGKSRCIVICIEYN